MKLEIGSVYNVRHERKGTFMIAVKSTDEIFTTGLVIGGKVHAIQEENEKGYGDKVTVRNSFCKFTPLDAGEKVNL